MRLKILYLFVLLLCPVTAWLQCNQQVLHMSGTQTIGCTSVTVTGSEEYCDTISGYCPGSTQPYWIGYETSTGICDDGSYTFTFNPPVSAVTLNFSATTNIGTDFQEQIVLYVNGQHYMVPAVGTPNGCEPLGFITPEGNISGTDPGTGWNGTTINGPITTLEVEDSIIAGQPAGSVFSLYICSEIIDFTIDLGSDTTLCNGDTLLLDPAVSEASLTWQDGSHNSVFEVLSPGNYSVEAVLEGCTASDEISVFYIECAPPNEPPVIPEFLLEMPNVFSPDGNGQNDVFVPVIAKGISEATLTILNRWGTKVFSGNLATGWDGKTDGKPAVEGVYFYRVDYTAPDGSSQMVHGFLHLVR